MAQKQAQQAQKAAEDMFGRMFKNPKGMTGGLGLLAAVGGLTYALYQSMYTGVLKSVVAKFNASQLITQRQQVSLLVRKELIERARDFNVILDDVSITELSFGREYAAAVESKQVAAQEAQRAMFYVERAKQERQEKIVRAEGEAQAAKMIGEALLKDPGYLKLRKIRAAQQIARTIAQSQNRVYLNAGSLMLNIADKDYGLDAETSAKKKR